MVKVEVAVAHHQEAVAVVETGDIASHLADVEHLDKEAARGVGVLSRSDPSMHAPTDFGFLPTVPPALQTLAGSADGLGNTGASAHSLHSRLS
mgnify:CR=1 FL=1